jgi:hypothetical protein
MKPFVVSIVVLGLVTATSFLVPQFATALAQETTAETPAPSGVAFEPVTGELVPPLVAEGAEVQLERASFSSGASYTIAAADAQLLLVSIESGALTVRSSTPLVINRAGEGTAATVRQEWVAADSELTLERGDSFVRPPRSQQELRNEGEEPTVALMASISGAPTDAPAGSTLSSGGGLVVALAVVVVPECEDGYVPAEVAPAATPGGGGGGGGAGGVAVAIAAAPECVGSSLAEAPAAASTPVP